MTTLVEKVARAIQAVTPEGYGLNAKEAEMFARAAIAAMREPYPDVVTSTHSEMVKWWNSVIDAALAEQDERK